MSWKEQILNYLDREFTEPIRDTVWGHIYLSEGLKKLTAAPQFQRLGRIMQLGPAFHVYPGATHTRLAHSLGVLHIAKKMLRKMIETPGCPKLTLENTKAFLSAALLHDLGHFPYTHSLKELPLAEHEALSGEMIVSSPLADVIRGALGIDPEQVRGVIDRDLEITGQPEVRFFRNILSGVLDPDKLDYLNRDAFFCGVPYGMQDIDFIISRIAPHPKSGIAVEESGINAVENILFSKYLMYRTVYWHKTVRIATAMVKKGVFQALQRGRIAPKDLYGIDDARFITLFGEKAPETADLIGGVTDRRFYKTAAEAAFSKENTLHTRLSDLESRNEYEKRTAVELGKAVGREVPETSVLVDIPEPISFEIDLPIRTGGGDRPFDSCESVFTPPVVRGFTHSLRKIRLILEPMLLNECLAKHIDLRSFIGSGNGPSNG